MQTENRSKLPAQTTRRQNVPKQRRRAARASKEGAAVVQRSSRPQHFDLTPDIRRGEEIMTEYVGPNYVGTFPNVPFYLLPTTNVVRSGPINPANLSCLNIIGGFTVTIQAAGLVNTQTLLIVATGGVAAKLKLDNNGTISGQSVYTLNPGTVLLVAFDGTNLS